MTQLLEAVPNFSEGRDLATVSALVDRIASFDVEVLDWSADPDHHRSVITFIGEPVEVERASLAAARLAIERIDLRGHEGVHPRVGAIDVLPYVPLRGLEMSDAVASAHRVGKGIAALGVPVFFYAYASHPAGRNLSELRKGGFEAIQGGWRRGVLPDVPIDAVRPHPTAGATCIGAREVLLAWNVHVDGIDVVDARRIAGLIRERDGGFPGLRALGLRLAGQDRVQVSMNLEDAERANPMDVFDRIESEVRALGGAILETEVIGMMPNTLVLPGAADRLGLSDLGSARVLSHRVAEHLAGRSGRRTEISDTTE